jgi:hypothetical protein
MPQSDIPPDVIEIGQMIKQRGVIDRQCGNMTNPYNKDSFSFRCWEVGYNNSSSTIENCYSVWLADNKSVTVGPVRQDLKPVTQKSPITGDELVKRLIEIKSLVDNLLIDAQIKVSHNDQL